MQCPIYMAYGMSYDDYWYGESWKTKAYREAYRIKARNEEAKMWRQGLYILDALNVALHNNINLSGKQITPAKYIEKPFEIIPKSEAEKRIEAEQERRKAVENLKAWGEAMRRKYNGGRNIESRTENTTE